MTYYEEYIDESGHTQFILVFVHQDSAIYFADLEWREMTLERIPPPLSHARVQRKYLFPAVHFKDSLTLLIHCLTAF